VYFLQKNTSKVQHPLIEQNADVQTFLKLVLTHYNMTQHTTADEQQLRSPICVVVGHVDHGKSSILDFIRKSNIVSSEAGAITQAIGASIISANCIRDRCGQLLEQMKLSVKIPGLLFIDTPGHAAFSSLRHRGGSLADIAILVVDIKEGCMPQTIESIKILRQYKTPFFIALNKIDTIKGYKTCQQLHTPSILGTIAKQDDAVTQQIETQLYTVIGQLSEIGFEAERFDRVSDFSKQIALVPTSAKIGDGMSELLMVLCALSQKYLEPTLQAKINGFAKGTILEVKEQKGVGTVLDAIIYEGTLKVNDTIVIGDLHKPIVTKIRGLFIPDTLTDMRDKKTKYASVQQVVCATGVRIVAPNTEAVFAGMPICATTPQQIQTVSDALMAEIGSGSLKTQSQGIIIKADTIGSLEAMLTLLTEKGIPVRVAELGNITKRDILEAQSNKNTQPTLGCILGFNVTQTISDQSVKVITAQVIYELVDKYLEWKAQIELELKKESLAGLTSLAKIKYLPGYTFRQSNPAVIGIEVLAGELVVGTTLIKEDTSKAGIVKGLQEQKTAISKAKAGVQVACSLEGVMAGRQIQEGDIYYTQIDEEYAKFKDQKDLISASQKELLKEISEVMRKKFPAWGV
jgi:translation initiation factor 5B